MIKLNPRVQWGRQGFVGRVVLYWEEMKLEEREALTKIVVSRVNNDWTSYDEVSGGIRVYKPRTSNLGGGALREEIDHRVRDVRDAAKAVLRDYGFKGVR